MQHPHPSQVGAGGGAPEPSISQSRPRRGPGASSGADGGGAWAEPRLSPGAARFAATLAEIIEILEDHDEQGWALRLSGLVPGDLTALRRLMPARGDAEDFQAVYLTTRHGRWLPPQDEVRVNERLSLLRAKLYMDARALVDGK